MTIKPFKGEKPVTSLEVVPCRIWDKTDGGKLRTRLEARGMKWVDHLPGKQVNYRGQPFKPGRTPVRGIPSLFRHMSFVSVLITNSR